MKKRILMLSVVLLIACVFPMAGCTALKATDNAKEMLAEYYDYYNDMDIDECIDMFGDEIIDDVGGDDEAEIVFNSRRYILGEVDDYEIVSFDSEGLFGDAQVVLEVEVEYENCEDEVEEEYVIYVSGDDLEIAGIDYGDNNVLNSWIDDYFEDYYNMNHVQGYYIPYVISNFFSADEVGALADSAYAAGGEYKDHEITNLVYYNDELSGWDDDIYYVAQVDAELEFEYEDFILYAEFSSEDEELNFNYLEYYPKQAVNILEDYYSNCQNKNTANILNMYSDEFFAYSEVTSQEWQTNWLDIMVNDYGAFIGYEIYEWEYSVIPLNEGDYEAYSFSIVSEYENAYFDEYITIIKGRNGSAILGHSISAS